MKNPFLIENVKKIRNISSLKYSNIFEGFYPYFDSLQIPDEAEEELNENFIKSLSLLTGYNPNNNQEEQKLTDLSTFCSQEQDEFWKFKKFWSDWNETIEYKRMGNLVDTNDFDSEEIEKNIISKFPSKDEYESWRDFNSCIKFFKELNTYELNKIRYQFFQEIIVLKNKKREEEERMKFYEIRMRCLKIEFLTEYDQLKREITFTECMIDTYKKLFLHADLFIDFMEN